MTKEQITQHLHDLSEQRSDLMMEIHCAKIRYIVHGLRMDMLNHERDLLGLVEFCNTGKFQ